MQKNTVSFGLSLVPSMVPQEILQTSPRQSKRRRATRESLSNRSPRSAILSTLGSSGNYSFQRSTPIRCLWQPIPILQSQNTCQGHILICKERTLFSSMSAPIYLPIYEAPAPKPLLPLYLANLSSTRFAFCSACLVA